MKASQIRVCVLRIEGTNCEEESYLAFRRLGTKPEKVHLKQLIGMDVSHEEKRSLSDYHVLVIPGGFSSGDYVRAGAIFAARMKSRLSKDLVDFVKSGKPLLGICNGFQILIEAGLLPGALLRNASLRFVCKWTNLKVESADTAFTCSFEKNTRVRMPIAHNEGRFFSDDALLRTLERNKQIVMRYSGENPTGTLEDIVAVSNVDANVVGMMPHPERASSSSLGGTDGLKVFQSMMEWVQ